MVGYLLASMPTPALGETPGTVPDAFLEACRGFVSASRVRDLTIAMNGVPADAGRAGPAHDAAARAWQEAAALVDDAVALRRSERRRDHAVPTRRSTGFRVDVAETVARAFDEPNPGVRERALDRLRWRLADELASTAPDGFAALLARGVHLRLAWRWARWDAEAGWSALESTLRRLEERHA
jgi:hypothetical protein